VTDFAALTFDHDTMDFPFAVAVRGGELLIMGRNGSVVPMTIEAARRSALRMLDAIEVAGGHIPTSRDRARTSAAYREPQKVRA
jgi:hypothetical protein